jgi:hypothetical protein
VRESKRPYSYASFSVNTPKSPSFLPRGLFNPIAHSDFLVRSDEAWRCGVHPSIRISQYLHLKLSIYKKTSGDLTDNVGF